MIFQIVPRLLRFFVRSDQVKLTHQSPIQLSSTLSVTSIEKGLSPMPLLRSLEQTNHLQIPQAFSQNKQKKCFICQVLQLLPFNLLIDHFSSIAYRYNKTELFQLNSFLSRRPRTFFTQSAQLNSTGCLSGPITCWTLQRILLHLSFFWAVYIYIKNLRTKDSEK